MIVTIDLPIFSEEYFSPIFFFAESLSGRFGFHTCVLQRVRQVFFSTNSSSYSLPSYIRGIKGGNSLELLAIERRGPYDGEETFFHSFKSNANTSVERRTDKPVLLVLKIFLKRQDPQKGLFISWAAVVFDAV